MLKFSIAGLIMAGIHIAILAYTLARILTAGAADWTVYWRMFLALDFPVSLAVVPLTWIAPPSAAGPLSDFANFWWPLVVHGLLGTLWWYIVGMSIGERLARFRASASKRDDSQT
ncbi:MAG TPA: hypothetical protein VMH26_21245 [Burkholderiales bacterium]|nr:hypothetical protein [Burkholderiales bacterium]